ncbi:MAG: stage II sporulation protein D [Clostridiales bacterium]|nr:stage II sporulation protein D [Clostridiales bacterium]MCF8023382.1 stage II sporulation protein D [Clostridiales bacterium]
MKKLLIATLVAIILISGIPLFLNWYTGPEDEGSLKVRLYRNDIDKIEKLSLNEYVAGVVAAEMPAKFPIEALKAQAVAARTYVLKRIHAGGVVNKLHPGADVSDDPDRAQAWISREKMKERWGVVNYYRYYFKIRQAADATKKMIITYDGKLIDPVYHSACGGRTEDSGEVWKYSIPYLKSVNCPYEADPRPIHTASFTLPEMEKSLGVDMSAVPVSSGESPVKITERTDTGRASKVRVAGVEIPATVFRQRLNLRSTNFASNIKGDKVIFTTRGYGHGVGMCQYGAKGMADHGCSYREILKHYYTGVNVQKY